MTSISPEKARAKLLSTPAKKAFDALNELGPQWICGEGSNAVSLFPDIYIRSIDSNTLSCVGGGAKTFDAAVTAQFNAILEGAAGDGKLVVVNAYDDDRAEFTYDDESGTFSPYVE